jgi:hypothetical protein
MHAFARTAAATVVVALAAATAAACSTSSRPAPVSTSTASTSTASSPPADVPSLPRYYVTLDPARADRLIVRATLTSAAVATVDVPPHQAFSAVFGTATGRVFVVDAHSSPPTPGGGDGLYLLRLDPGSGTPVPLVLVHAGHAVGPGLTALAVSPDATKIAIAYTYATDQPRPQPVILYSVPTGAVLRTWTVSSGIISSADPMGNGDLGQDAGGTSMRWTADGRGLAYAFHANAAPGKQGFGYQRAASIRLLDTTMPGSDLIANSRVLNGPGPAYNPGNGGGTQCLVSSGWSVSADGRAVTCAAQWGTPDATVPAGLRTAGCSVKSAASTAKQPQVNLGFWRQFSLPDGSGGEGTIYGVCRVATPVSIGLFWASPDGTAVLGTLDYPGHPMFGVFRDGTFRKLPPLPAGVPLASIAW